MRQLSADDYVPRQVGAEAIVFPLTVRDTLSLSEYATGESKTQAVICVLTPVIILWEAH